MLIGRHFCTHFSKSSTLNLYVAVGNRSMLSILLLMKEFKPVSKVTDAVLYKSLPHFHLFCEAECFFHFLRYSLNFNTHMYTHTTCCFLSTVTQETTKVNKRWLIFKLLMQVSQQSIFRGIVSSAKQHLNKQLLQERQINFG